ncbi:hypothetical protein MP638_002153 [Amoeboaphelidium occidentale]|nr:hypothetical protein MP638_002153 [Amoeboaphelidium occidentale]
MSSSDSLHEDVLKTLKALTSTTDKIDEQLSVLYKHQNVSEITEGMDLMDESKLLLLLTYALNSLVFVYLRLSAEDPSKHEVMNEIKRVKEYIEKAKSVEASRKGPKSRVDQSAAKRIVKHYTETSSKEQ